MSLTNSLYTLREFLYNSKTRPIFFLTNSHHLITMPHAGGETTKVKTDQTLGCPWLLWDQSPYQSLGRELDPNGWSLRSLTPRKPWCAFCWGGGKKCENEGGMRIMVMFYRLGCSLHSFSGGDMKDISLERGLECCFIPPDSQKKDTKNACRTKTSRKMFPGKKTSETCFKKLRTKEIIATTCSPTKVCYEKGSLVFPSVFSWRFPRLLQLIKVGTSTG